MLLIEGYLHPLHSDFQPQIGIFHMADIPTFVYQCENINF